MVGVIRYSGRCKVCRHPERRTIEAALLARLGSGRQLGPPLQGPPPQPLYLAPPVSLSVLSAESNDKSLTNQLGREKDKLILS
jgi:hypothetical protein